MEEKLCPLTRIMPSEYERCEEMECDQEICAWWVSYSTQYAELTGRTSYCAITHIARSLESRE